MPAACARKQLQLRPIRLAQLARNEQTQTQPLVASREERLEDLILEFFRNPRAVINDMQFYAPVRQRQATNAHTARQVLTMAQGIAHQIPQDLQQLRTIETEGRSLTLQHQHRRIYLLDHHELGEKSLQKILKINGLGNAPVSAPKLEHILHDTIQAEDIILHDLKQPFMHLAAALLVQELRSMADRRQGIADLVRDAGGQAAQRSQLQMLRLFANAGDILEKEQNLASRSLRGHKARAQNTP
ncbi:MAG TPA: hypothetical protein PLW86_13195 [Rhodocyclaceae bacterium]|nr:hypothetical protein [Rhodocyclaceae bacterium]